MDCQKACLLVAGLDVNKRLEGIYNPIRFWQIISFPTFLSTQSNQMQNISIFLIQ